MLTGSIIGDIKHQFRYGDMVMKLIFVNVGVFLIFGIIHLFSYLFSSGFYPSFLEKFEAPASLPQLLRQPWSVISYMFLHEAPLHILFNMLWLYWFGQIFVLYLGDKKVLPLYLIGGLAGALTYILAFNLIPVFRPSVDVSYMLGASASIYAIVFAAATINPNHEIGLLFFGQVKIKYLAIVPLLLDIREIPNGNAGGYIAHVGGAICGYLFITILRSGYDFTRPLNKFFDWAITLFNPRSKVKVTYKNTERKSPVADTRSQSDQDKVDEILDKIARSGYDSLTKEEKDFLFNYSKK